MANIKKYKKYQTYDGIWFKVSPEDYSLVKNLGDKFGYHLDKDSYIVCNYKKKGKTHTFRVHRLIAKLKGYRSIKGLHIDHIDRDKLNNTRENIRVAGSRMNNRNRSNVKNY